VQDSKMNTKSKGDTAEEGLSTKLPKQAELLNGVKSHMGKGNRGRPKVTKKRHWGQGQK